MLENRYLVVGDKSVCVCHTRQNGRKPWISWIGTSEGRVGTSKKGWRVKERKISKWMELNSKHVNLNSSKYWTISNAPTQGKIPVLCINNQGDIKNWDGLASCITGQTVGKFWIHSFFPQDNRTQKFWHILLWGPVFNKVITRQMKKQKWELILEKNVIQLDRFQTWWQVSLPAEPSSRLLLQAFNHCSQLPLWWGRPDYCLKPSQLKWLYSKAIYPTYLFASEKGASFSWWHLPNTRNLTRVCWVLEPIWL